MSRSNTTFNSRRLATINIAWNSFESIVNINPDLFLANRVGGQCRSRFLKFNSIIHRIILQTIPPVMPLIIIGFIYMIGSIFTITIFEHLWPHPGMPNCLEAGESRINKPLKRRVFCLNLTCEITHFTSRTLKCGGLSFIPQLSQTSLH